MFNRIKIFGNNKWIFWSNRLLQNLEIKRQHLVHLHHTISHVDMEVIARDTVVDLCIQDKYLQVITQL